MAGRRSDALCDTSPKTSAPPESAATLQHRGWNQAAADKPMHAHPAPRTDTPPHKSSSRPAYRRRSTKESVCTVRCTGRTPSRDTCKSPSRRRTTPPTAESRDADTNHASQTRARRSAAPAAEDVPAAAQSSSYRAAVPRHESPDTNRRRSTRPMAPAQQQCQPVHSRYPI